MKIQSKSFKSQENRPCKNFQMIYWFYEFNDVVPFMGKKIQGESCQTSIGQIVLAYMKGVYFFQRECHSFLPLSSKLALKAWARVHRRLKIIWERLGSRRTHHLN